jgi:ribosomal protein S18 acetylase RimI-like enzyme
MRLPFIFKKFPRSAFENYKSWFEDTALQNTLGGVDEEWLAHVLTDETGEELAVFREEVLLAVVGIVYPTLVHPYYVISNMAVRPDLAGQGIGSKVLKELIARYVLRPNEYWKCYVETSNTVARRFFEKNGWQSIAGDVEEGMIGFALGME